MPASTPEQEAKFRAFFEQNFEIVGNKIKFLEPETTYFCDSDAKNQTMMITAMTMDA